MAVSPIVPDGIGGGWTGRVLMAAMQAGAMASPFVVLTGDSRAASCPMSALGGLPLLQCGMPGIRVNDACNYVPQAAANASSPKAPEKPSLIVLQIGVNNAFLEPTCDEMASFCLDFARS